jgi:hypothetical protein
MKEKKVMAKQIAFNKDVHGRTMRTPAYATFSVYKAAEGGRSFRDAKEELEAVGVTDIKQVGSPYIGQYGIQVPKRFEKRTSRVLYGR